MPHIRRLTYIERCFNGEQKSKGRGKGEGGTDVVLVELARHMAPHKGRLADAAIAHEHQLEHHPRRRRCTWKRLHGLIRTQIENNEKIEGQSGD